MSAPDDDDQHAFLITEDLEFTPGLPINESDLVVIGEITDANAFLSNNKRNVYSEFSFRISEVLKKDDKGVSKGDSISVDREGGYVQYDNGKKRLYLIGGLGMPRVGRRYVLFLKNPEKTPNYGIVSGYELSADGTKNLNGSEVARVYAGMAEASFMKTLRGTIETHIKPQEKDEPTIVQKRVMTEKQRRHSQEFEDREIPGIAETTTRDVGVYIDIGPGRLPTDARVTNQTEYLQALTCASITDAVVIGRISRKASQLTESGRFVFTDYDLEVREILKKPSGASVDNVITITDPGGAVRLDGRNIFATISREQPLRIGQSYILFLRRLKDSDSYRLIGDRGIFTFSQEQVKPTHYKFGDGFTYNDIVAQIRLTSVSCQSGKME